VFLFSLGVAGALVTADGHEDLLIDESAKAPSVRSPDWAETKVPPPSFPPRLQTFGPIVPAARQPVGALTGRIIFMNGGHGWTFDPDRLAAAEAGP
jgi:hypothetical protein